MQFSEFGLFLLSIALLLFLLVICVVHHKLVIHARNDIAHVEIIMTFDLSSPFLFAQRRSTKHARSFQALTKSTLFLFYWSFLGKIKLA